MQNFWSKQSNAIKQDSFHINDERSLTKQLRINQSSFSKRTLFMLEISDSLRFELKIFNSKRILSTRIKDLALIETF
jgi:hypothetical protein